MVPKATLPTVSFEALPYDGSADLSSGALAVHGGQALFVAPAM